jgi:hypothetical protein
MIKSEIGGFDPDYYYVVDGHKTTSRNQALLWAGGDIKKIYFYCLEHVWDHANWALEPDEDISVMCQKRCHQLRDNFDWLCLWLSGGYDSQTVLKSFIDSGVKLDEIAFMDRSEYYNDPELPIIIAAINNYKKYHNPHLKVFRVDTGYNYTNNVYKKLKEDWVLEPGCCFRPSKSIAPFLQRYHDDVVRTRTTAKGSRADIYGKEKPKLNLYQDKWYMCVNDLTVGDSAGADIIEFYTTKDYPELHVKQCYLAIKFFESLVNCSHELVHQIQSNDPTYYQQWNTSLGRTLVPDFISRNGINKFYFTQSLHSPESKKIIRHMQSEKNNVLNMFMHSMDTFVSAINDFSITSPIMSKSWYICDFGKFKSLDQTAMSIIKL